MKPRFALNFTHEKAMLLHRSGRGWQEVGEAAFDAPDLAEAMGYLRSTALGLSPKGLATKLVIPNSQILYTEVEAPGPDIDNRRTQILAALEGRTPYAVEDLVFDWSGDGPTVKVAVVARETLDEAEAFAVEHRFNPVSFVAVPEDGAFKGEPWFGPTAVSATLLAPGEKIERDSAPISVQTRSLPRQEAEAGKAASAPPGSAPSESVPPAAEAAPAVPETPAPPAEPVIVAEAAAPVEAVAEAPAEVAPDAPEEAAAEPPVEAPFAAAPDAPPEALPEAPLEAPAPRAEAEELPTPPSTFAAAPPEAPAPAPEEPAVEAAPAPEPPRQSPFALTDRAPAEAAAPAEPDEAPFTHVPDTAADPVAPHAGTAPVSVLEDDLPPEPSAAARLAFASRRAADSAAPPVTADRTGPAARGGATAMPTLVAERIAARAKDKPTADLAGKAPPRPPLAAPIGAGKGKAQAGIVTAQSIPGMKKRKGAAAATAIAPSAVVATTAEPIPRKPLTKPGGTFAGKPASTVGGKPKYLGLILTGMLLLLLAIAAAWSSYFLASNRTEDADAALAAATAPEDEMLADGIDPADLEPALPDATEVAALPVDEPPLAEDAAEPAAPVAAVDETPDEPAPVAEAAPEPVAEPVAEPLLEPAPETGVAETVAREALPLDAQDEIFLSAMDQPPAGRDTAALPKPAATGDSLPAPQMPPPPFGTVYQFDENGLIRPTPEGIVTPEGVRLVAGAPARVPPARPADLVPPVAEDAAAAAPTDPAATDPVAADPAAADPAAAPAPAADPALAGARPRARPAGAVPAGAVPEGATGQADDDAAVTTAPETRLATLRPRLRPAAILAAGEEARRASAAASLASEAAVLTLASAAAPDPNRSPLAVAVSRKPAARPKDLTKAVEAAVAAAVRQPEPQAPDPEPPAAERSEPEADDEPEVASAAPKIPTRASVAKTATFVNAINLSKMNLIGVYGTQSKRYALIRQSNGRYKKVKVGDRIDGGTIQAITASEVRYQKGSRLVTLSMPKG